MKFAVDKKAFCAVLLAVFLLNVIFGSACRVNYSEENAVNPNSLVLTDGSTPINDNLELYSSISSDADDLLGVSEPYDYLFWTNGTNYFVTNGTTIDSGSDIAHLVETVVSGSSEGLFLCFRTGVYRLFSTIDIIEKSNIRIVGAGRELTKFVVSADITAFNVTGNPENHNLRFDLSGCSIDGGAVLSTNCGVYIKHMDSVQLHDLDVTCFDTHVYVEDCQKPNVYNLGVWSDRCFSYGLYFKGYNLDIKLHEVSVLHSDPNAVGVRFENYDSIELSKVYVNPTVTTKGTGSGFVFVDCHFVHLVGCVADGNGNAGYYLSSGFGFYFVDCWSGSNLNGLLSVDADQLQISSCQFYSNAETGATITAANEVYPSCSISGSHFLHNKLYGLELENTNHSIVLGNHFRNNTLYGIYYSKTNDYAIITNNDATGNLHPNYDVYIGSPCLEANLQLKQNFGRIYLAAQHENK